MAALNSTGHMILLDEIIRLDVTEILRTVSGGNST